MRAWSGKKAGEVGAEGTAFIWERRTGTRPTGPWKHGKADLIRWVKWRFIHTKGLKGFAGMVSWSDLDQIWNSCRSHQLVWEKELQELQGKELGGYWVVQAKDDRLGGHRDAENLMDPERVWRFKKKKKSQIWEVTKHWGKRGTKNDKSSGLTRQRRAVTPRNMGTGWGLGGLDLMSLRLQVGKWIYWVGQGDVMYKQP